MASPSPIGEVLNRDPKREDARDSIKITGRVNNLFVATPADGFGPPFPISQSELVAAYGLEVADEDDDAVLRKLDAEQNEKAAAGLFRGTVTTHPAPAHDSPEGKFRAVEAAAAEATAAPEDEPDDG